MKYTWSHREQQARKYQIGRYQTTMRSMDSEIHVVPQQILSATKKKNNKINTIGEKDCVDATIQEHDE